MTILNLNAECGCEIETDLYSPTRACYCGPDDYCYCYDYETDYAVYSTKIVKPCDKHGG